MKIKIILALMAVSLLSACVIPPPFGWPGRGRGGGGGGDRHHDSGDRHDRR